MDNNKSIYETNSLVLGSTLICLGFNLDSVYKDPSGKAIFFFLRSNELENTLESFWKKELKVEPNSFFEAQKFLKSRIYGS